MKVFASKFAFLFIPLLIIIAYIPIFQSGFTNWDDPAYVLNNSLIRSLSWDNISAMWSGYYQGHYHPLTWMSLALDYSLWGIDDAFGFHFSSLLLHMLNSVLVYFLFVNLSKKNTYISLLAAGLFALHPMNVESVAWISERKNLLFAFFFLASSICYIRFTVNRKWMLYIASVLLFFFSLFSKSMALSLVLSLPLYDLLLGRKFLSVKLLLEKTPYALGALLFGWLAMNAQDIVMSNEFVLSWFERAQYACFALFAYMFKLIVPVQLSAYYPYFHDGVPAWMIAFVILFLAAVIFMLIRMKKIRKYVIVGLLFFFVNIFFVLKFFKMPSGSYYMADRYVYISGLGIFLIILWWMESSQKKISSIIRKIMPFVVLLFGILSFVRAGVWQNSVLLWEDVISKTNPSVTALGNRGNAYKDIKQYHKALKDYNEALKLSDLHQDIYLNRAFVKNALGDYEGAISDYEQMLKFPDPKPETYQSLAAVYINRGNKYFNNGQLKEAYIDYSNSIEILPQNSLAYLNRANVLVQLNDLDSAMIDYDRAILYDEKNVKAWLNRGNTYFYLGETEKCIEDLSKAIRLDPSLTDAFLNRANARFSLGDLQGAIEDYSMVISRQSRNAEVYYYRAMAYLQMGNMQACNDFQSAYQLGMQAAGAALQKYCQ